MCKLSCFSDQKLLDIIKEEMEITEERDKITVEIAQLESKKTEVSQNLHQRNMVFQRLDRQLKAIHEKRKCLGKYYFSPKKEKIVEEIDDSELASLPLPDPKSFNRELDTNDVDDLPVIKKPKRRPRNTIQNSKKKEKSKSNNE